MSGEVSVLRMIRSTLNADLAAVSRVDLKAGFFSHIVETGASSGAEKFESPFVPTTCCATVVSRKEPLIIGGLEVDDDQPQCPMMKAEGCKASLGVPIATNDRVVGAVEAICGGPRNWTVADLESIAKFARIVESIMPIDLAEVHVPKIRLVN